MVSALSQWNMWKENLSAFIDRESDDTEHNIKRVLTILLTNPKYFFESLSKQFQWVSLYLRLRIIYRKVKNDPARYDYIDTALEPVTDHEEEREMFQSDAARTYLDKVHHIDAVRRGESVAKL